MPPGIATNLRKVFPMGLVRPECGDHIRLATSRDGVSSVQNLLLTMFPTRILSSTVILAFAVLASASPLTIQVEVVLDDVKAGLTHAGHANGVTTAFPCELQKTKFPELEYYPEVRLLTRNPC